MKRCRNSDKERLFSKLPFVLGIQHAISKVLGADEAAPSIGRSVNPGQVSNPSWRDGLRVPNYLLHHGRISIAVPSFTEL